MQDVTLIGIDTAKNIFHLHAVNKHGKEIYQRKLTRCKLLDFLAQQPICTIAIESCSGSYYWARSFKKLGHSVKIISARHVNKFANSRNKNDFNDAKAIVKAASDPDINEVAHKSISQQEIQVIHVMRDGLIRSRTAAINRLRALLAEFGIVLPQGREKLMSQLPSVLEQENNELTQMLRQIINDQYEAIKKMNEEIKKYDQRIKNCVNRCENSKRLQNIPSVGPIISTALSYMIADPKIYKNGRQCAASLGLTPKEHSSGGKQRLGRISCEGNNYLRKILVQGAQAVLRRSKIFTTEPLLKWAYHLKTRRGNNIAAIALANKVVRIAWALLVNQANYAYKRSI